MAQLPLHNALVIHQCAASGSVLSFFNFQTTIISSVLIITQTCQMGGGERWGQEREAPFVAFNPNERGKTETVRWRAEGCGAGGMQLLGLEHAALAWESNQASIGSF